jgi:hypothetical protein
MESIMVHPENEVQLETLKAVLKALKIPFEPQSTSFPSHISKSIEKSLKQFESGETISIEQFTEKHFSKK